MVSDAHEKWDMLDKLVKVRKNTKYDIVLLSGDQANGNNVIGAKNDAEMNRIAEESNKRYVQTLEKFGK